MDSKRAIGGFCSFVGGLVVNIIQATKPDWFGNHAWILPASFIVLLVGLLVWICQYSWAQKLLGISPKGETEKLERSMENSLVRKGILPDVPKPVPAADVSAPEILPPKNAKLDGELYRVVTSAKGAFVEITRQFFESMRKEFAIDVDIMLELYIVNLSTETQYIRDLDVSVEIDGQRKELIRQNDFYAYEVNNTDYEYCLDPDPDGSKFEVEERAETLAPIFPSLPIEVSPRKPLEGWARFLLKDVDPKKLENNRSYAFKIVDSLGEEHTITRSRKRETASRIGVRRKGIRK
jgi:hypothetical protein